MQYFSRIPESQSVKEVEGVYLGGDVYMVKYGSL